MSTQIAKFHTGFLESTQLPKTDNMIPAKTLLPAEAVHLGKNSVALFVEFEGKIYAAHPEEMVPETAVIERNESGQLCGIPAVTGG